MELEDVEERIATLEEELERLRALRDRLIEERERVPSRLESLFDMLQHRPRELVRRTEARALQAVGPAMGMDRYHPLPDLNCRDRYDKNDPLDISTDDAMYLARINELSLYGDGSKKALTRPELCRVLADAGIALHNGQADAPKRRSVRRIVKQRDYVVPLPARSRFTEPVSPVLDPVPEDKKRVYVDELGYWGKMVRKALFGRKDKLLTRKTSLTKGKM